ITFAIPGAGPHVIRPPSVLPKILDPAVIDGYTQPGAARNTLPAGQGLNTIIKIQLDGSLLPDTAFLADAPALEILAGSTRVEGLSITGVRDVGIYINKSNDNVIAGNFIGVTPSGAAAGN